MTAAALLAALAVASTGVEARVEAALAGAPPGGARAARATAPLLGAPYLLSPLGEGGGRDPDPRFRLDAFDCVTFVETAIALGSSASLAEARRALDLVRYAGAPAYEARNHEVLSQWIPRNLAQGFVAPLALVPDDAAHRAAVTYDAARWEAVRAAGRSLAGLPRRALPAGRFEVAIVPPAEVEAVAPRLPEGAVVFVVREDRPARPTRVTHSGLVVHGPGGAPLVRHATSSRGVARVVEEPLSRFLAREARAYPRWPLSGLAFLAVPDASARVRAGVP